MKEQYWESPEEIRKIQERLKIRQRLQAEFNRIAYNPYRLSQHIELSDPAVSRYSAMRSAFYEHWKPSWRSFWVYGLVTWAPILFLTFRYERLKNKTDADCRTGKIPYEERDFRRF